MPRLHTAAAALRPAFVTPHSLPLPSPCPSHRRLLRATPVHAQPSLTVRHQAPKTKNDKRPRALVAAPGTARPHRIAVVGGGLAGLAVAYHLTHSTARYARKRGFDAADLRVTVLDPYPTGVAGGSAAAAGLLHDFAPRPKRKAWQAAKAFDSALQLIEAVGAPVLAMPGLLRVARGPRDEEDFLIAARRFPRQLEHLSARDLIQRYPHLNIDLAALSLARDAALGLDNGDDDDDDVDAHDPRQQDPPSALLYRRAHVVDTPAYLRALRNSVAASGRAAFRVARVSDIHALYAHPLPTSSSAQHADPTEFDGPFDTVVLAAGAANALIRGLPDLPQTVSRGTNLLLRSHAHTPPNVPLIGSGYAVPDFTFGSGEEEKDTGDMSTTSTSAAAAAAPARMLVGTRRDRLPAPQPTAPARQPPTRDDADAMRAAVDALVPGALDEWTPTAALVGDRAVPTATPRGAVPIACRLRGAPPGTSAWLLSGLAGRGLLYHAFLGRVVAHAVVAGNDRLIPLEARRFDLALRPRDDLSDGQPVAPAAQAQAEAVSTPEPTQT